MSEYLFTRFEESRWREIVGDILGTRFMLRIELVADWETKERFDPRQRVDSRLADIAVLRGLDDLRCIGCA